MEVKQIGSVINLDSIPQAQPSHSDEGNTHREEDLRRFKAVAELLSDAGGERYSGYKFSTWKSDSPRKQKVYEGIEKWADTFPERKANANGLILYGTVGTGKDHLAYAAVRKAILKHGATVNWKNGRELFGEVRDNIGSETPERDLIRKLSYRDILVIADPLPVMGDLTNAQSDMFYRIVEACYAAKKLIVVTINVEDSKQGRAKIGSPTWDRLCHNAWVAKFDWPSERKPALVI
jgi:DNA replication protein DnaC